MNRFIRSFWKLTKQDKLPRLKRDFRQPERNLEGLEREVEYILALGIARDENQARYLLDEYGVDDVLDLIPLLPVKRPNVRQRFRNWLASLEGAYTSDPHKHDLYDIRQRS